MVFQHIFQIFLVENIQLQLSKLFFSPLLFSNLLHQSSAGFTVHEFATVAEQSGIIIAEEQKTYFDAFQSYCAGVTDLWC